MTYEELKNDANFMYCGISEVIDYIYHNLSNQTKYVSLLYMIGDEPVVRTWGFRENSKGKVMYTEVERKALHLEYAIRKNCYLTAMSGYKVMYEPKTVASGNWYGYTYYCFDGNDFDKWFHEKQMGICTHLLGIDKLFECEKWEYCAWSSEYDLFHYLLKYEKEPMVEYFGKAKIPISSTLINKAKKDRQFAKYLVANAKDVRAYGAQATIKAYKEGITIKKAKSDLTEKHDADVCTKDFNRIKESGVNRVKIYRYIRSIGNKGYSYRDYWNACVALGLDMNDTKNSMPRDFERMHDLRTQEYGALRAKLEQKEKRKMERDFKAAAALYLPTVISNEKYTIVLPQKTKELVREGNALHHCVGRMGYDKKMADGKCVIAFIRAIGDENTPFVTCEYTPKDKKISQCYADHDSKPLDEVIEFANAWAKQISKMKVGAGA